ncbi:MAG TPA: succinate dehydrogenase assembly factor 2 [Leucothrix mucor]|uniref:FAD assembly factor SdhE n=1 Tax=Leucothrix mucor TaxID=45248 RepID=A0A7V2WVX8_LEUMU|nr:succinate dehydrogenase assembly factor 2 [Leucothrix mucor]
MSKISQLKWQCRRGTKELDFILNNYLERYYQNASQSEQSAFKQLIELDDPILSDLFLGESLVDNTIQQNLILKLVQLTCEIKPR